MCTIMYSKAGLFETSIFGSLPALQQALLNLVSSNWKVHIYMPYPHALPHSIFIVLFVGVIPVPTTNLSDYPAIIMVHVAPLSTSHDGVSFCVLFSSLLLDLVVGNVHVCTCM